MPTTQATPVDVDDDAEVQATPDPEALLDRLETIGQQVGAFVRERPLAAVGIALFAGFMIGRLARR
ncbi:MAG TPA: hypothetical protein VFG69_07455 [Nannocystaceae bacterium]|nr:hypothetical protein [Nannocystaceae bacterium]